MSNGKTSILQPSATVLLLQLVSLLVVLAVIPLFERYAASRAALNVGLTVLFVLGLLINRSHAVLLMSGGILAVLALPLMWTSLFVDQVVIFAVSCALGAVFFGLTAVVILCGVLRWYTATVHSIYGAVSAYLLLGLAWAMLYWGLDAFDGNAFEIPQRRTLAAFFASRELTSFSQMIYYSFVCMSSLGFGDISPTTEVAELLTWLQSVVGQFYLAILVAWIVGAIPGVRSKVENSPTE